MKSIFVASCCLFLAVYSAERAYAQTQVGDQLQSNIKQLWPLNPIQVVNSSFETTPGPYLAPAPVAPTQDPFISVKQSLPKGIFVYAPLSTNQEYGTRRYFVLRGSQVVGSVGDEKSTIATYGAADGDGKTFDPLFSPNGRTIAFKSGDKGDDHSRYDLFLWDMYERKIIKATKRLIYFQQVAWCPDSQKIAFVTGGNSLGDELPGDAPTTLDVYDKESNEQKTIVPHPVVFLGNTFNYHGLRHFQWTDKNTVVYSRLPEVTDSKSVGQPNIYVTDLQTMKQIKIVDDAYAPNPSPDGQWIAFLSRPRDVAQAEKLEEIRRKETFGLYLFNRKEGRIRYLSEVQIGSTPSKSMGDLSLLWTPDSRSFVIIASYFVNPKSSQTDRRLSTKPQSVTEVQISTVQMDVLSKSEQSNSGMLIQTLRFDNSQTNQSASIEPLSVSEDGTSLFVKKIEEGYGGAIVDRQTLLAIDLRDGSLAEQAVFSVEQGDMEGWDWIYIR